MSTTDDMPAIEPEAETARVPSEAEAEPVATESTEAEAEAESEAEAGAEAVSSEEVGVTDPAQAGSANSPARRKLDRAGIAVIAASVLALAGWTAFGITLAQANATSDELAQSQASVAELSSTNDKLTDDLAAMTESRDGYKADADDVAAREAKVSEREQSVKTREDAITAKETQIAQTTLKDGYAYTVGLTAEPGVYQATSSSTRCYWSIYTSGTNYSDIVDNDLGSMGVIRVSLGGGQDFKSNSCGDWTKVG